MKSILVTGGTGVLGRAVVDHLLSAGHQVRVASRRPQPPDGSRPYGWSVVNYRSGRGLDSAVAGVDAIVHCAGEFRGVEVDRNLAAAARRAGGPLFVYISIVGVDRVPLGYYRAKLAAERLIADSGVPHTILRATQFHDLIRVGFAALVRAPVLVVPELSVQPIDVGEVAAQLAELAAGSPEGRVPDLGGPRVRSMRDLARAYLRATARRRPVLAVRLPGEAFHGYQRGGHLAPDRAVGRVSFEDYLASYPAPLSTSYRRRP